MTSSKYLPNSDADRCIWINVFALKLAIYGPALGVTAAELLAVQKDSAAYQYVVGLIENHRQYISSLTGYKNMMRHAVSDQHIGALPVLPVLATPPPVVPEGVFDRISRLVARFKKTTAYNDTIGADLGVIAPTPAIVDVATLQPELKIKLDVGRPHLKWVKGYSDAVDLYVDRNEGNGFILLGRLLKNEYIDITPIGVGKIFDQWAYRAMYVISDQPVGLYSDPKTIDIKKL
jgi:hypothetical protein